MNGLLKKKTEDMEDLSHMIKLIIFDLDGVLVDAKEIHYKALNRALIYLDPKYEISREEHLSKYDGLNTTSKLNMLTEEKGLPKELHNVVWSQKQQETIKIIDGFKFDNRLRSVLENLKNDEYQIAVASNSIRETVKMMLVRKGLIDFIDFYYSNQDVIHPKPNVEMYLQCMIKAGVSPKETVIVEDSHIGRKAALDSGAYLFAVKNSNDVDYTRIQGFIDSINGKTIKPKWQGGRMKILIPMAGAGSRFIKAGYSFPKPLIAVKNMNDKPMIQVIVENLNIDAEHIFIVQKEHCDKYNLKQLLNVISPNCKIVTIDHITEGAACTTLLAKEYIDNDEPLLIANSDQFVEWDSNEFMYSMMGDQIDGGILTFKNSHPKWSYVRLDENRFVTEVKEKEVVSNEATVGIYYWSHGADYVKYAEQMIANNIRVNNEFYVAPVYNEAIADNKKIKIFHIDKMWGLGTPEDLAYFQDKYK
jgi:HAD superfamily hydrolase (TIGR01509 family)